MGHLKNFQPGPSDLQQAEEGFQLMLRRVDVGLRMFRFYEALKMNDVLGKIVESWLAILPAYDSCSINADHRDMTKFTDRADAGYGQGHGVLSRWSREYHQGQLEGGKGMSGSNSDSADEREGKSQFYGGVTFNDPISGRNVVSGTQVTPLRLIYNFRVIRDNSQQRSAARRSLGRNLDVFWSRGTTTPTYFRSPVCSPSLKSKDKQISVLFTYE